MWLYLPSSVLPVEEEGSTREFTLRSAERLAQSATWRTKSAQPQSLLQAWKRNSWMTRLFGLTCEPSMVDLGAARWAGSLAVTRVSHSASQGADEGQATPVTSGPTSPALSGQLSLAGAFSKTSAVICDWDSEKSPKSFEAWATALRQHCGARRKSALLTVESGSSSWPTPRVSSGNGSKRSENNPKHRLETAADMWPTPNAHDGRRPGSDATSTQGRNLKREAEEQWSTPTSRDWKGATEPSEAVPTNSLLGHQAPRAMHGVPFPLNSGPRRLNPLFVAWLMGPYWLALIGYESSGMASSQSRQQQPLESCGKF